MKYILFICCVIILLLSLIYLSMYVGYYRGIKYDQNTSIPFHPTGYEVISADSVEEFECRSKRVKFDRKVHKMYYDIK